TLISPAHAGELGDQCRQLHHIPGHDPQASQTKTLELLIQDPFRTTAVPHPGQLKVRSASNSSRASVIISSPPFDRRSKIDAGI
ncbi:hypothetical protein P9272_35965, partial [Mesorhizobium sp. WSM4976]|uniref:hypothetical protein n=1 Tax=Mesorhizobium sp. WSM4976 TaxID=3038549 RepID=UPI0024168B59